METPDKIKEFLRKLAAIRNILQNEGEANWRQGIDAAISELLDPDGNLNLSGYENARSIYRSMVTGGRGFAEYYIWKNKEEDRIAANEELDMLRADVWRLMERDT